MKHIKTLQLSKKTCVAIGLSLVLAISLAVSIILTSVSGKTETKAEVSEPLAVLDGEARQNGLTLAYPSINSKNRIKFINIKNKTGEYGFMMYGDDNYHTLYYVDSNGKQVVYYPEICQADSAFEYSSFHLISSLSRLVLVDLPIEQ